MRMEEAVAERRRRAKAAQAFTRTRRTQRYLEHIKFTAFMVTNYK